MRQFNTVDLPPKLMYRPPGKEKHENITKVLDDIILKLESLENRLTSLENTHGADLQ